MVRDFYKLKTMKYFQRSLRPAERPVRGPRRFWIGAVLILIFTLAVGAWAELKAPEIPIDLKYRYMQHAFLNAEVQRQLNASMTPQQHAMADKLMEIGNALQTDNSEMSAKCGEKYVLNKDQGTNEPSCKPKDARSPEHAGGK
jgi:hypothetical protein